tara:strand:+ start:150 stop:416 length:267 start_codon:yes stop_codon:yes gene_type:complete
LLKNNYNKSFKIDLLVLYILMNLDCDTELIRATLINLREELKSEKERTRLYELRVKNMMDEWRKERKDYEDKIESLEGLLEVQNTIDK